MPVWSRRRSPRPAPTRRPPRQESASVARVELAELRPDPVEYLGQAAATTLALFENVGRAVQSSPDAGAKSQLARVAAPLLAAHEGIVAEIRRLGADPAEAMTPFAVAVDDFQRRTQGQDRFEILVTCYLTAGFLVDFFDALAGGLPADTRARVRALLGADRADDVLVAQLTAATEQHERLASRLAMWGRRLIGDTMLVARAAISADGGDPGSERIEPVFTELVAAHTRRMDKLGLTA